MFSKLALIAVASLAAFVAATPLPGGMPGSSCSTGPVQCCNSVQKASDMDGDYSRLAGLLGVQANDLTGMVGVACIPVSLIGGGNNCHAQTVCCQNNNFNGLIVVGCSPVSVL